MHFFLLALPLSLIVIGAVWYKRSRATQRDFEEPQIEGYYVVPPPLPCHPGQYWPTPGLTNYQGYPNHSQPLGPQSAPYQVPSAQYPATLTQPPPAAEVASGFQHTQIRSPDQVAQPGLSNVSSSITSEKVLVRNDSSLLLPAPSPSKETDGDLKWKETQEKKSFDRSNPVRVDAMDCLDAPNMAEKKCDEALPVSPALKGRALGPATQGSPTSVATLAPTPEVGVAERDIYEASVVAEAGPDGLNNVQSESVLPRYTSADAEIFKRFQNRISLKQDHSYIGRLNSSYTPPQTLSPPKRTIRDDNSFLNPPSNPDPKT